MCLEKTICKDGNNIILYALDDEIMAKCNNIIIGSFTYEKIEISNKYSETYVQHRLYRMHINENFQQKGIGTEMIRMGETVFEYVSYPDPLFQTKEEHYTEAGANLIAHCLKREIIKKVNISD